MSTDKERQVEGESMRMMSHASDGQSPDEMTVMAPALRDRQNAYFRTRLALLCDTIPRGTRRRTTRGRMAVCAQLGSHRRQAEQLFAYVHSPEDRKNVDFLIRRIEEARSQIIRQQGEWKVAQEKRRARRRKRRIGVHRRRFSSGYVAQSGRRKRCRSPKRSVKLEAKTPKFSAKQRRASRVQYLVILLQERLARLRADPPA